MRTEQAIEARRVEIDQQLDRVTQTKHRHEDMDHRNTSPLSQVLDAEATRLRVELDLLDWVLERT
jgi:hypothetical protein